MFWGVGQRIAIGSRLLTRPARIDTLAGMDRQTALRRLNRNKASLQALGLKRLSLFGSTARNEASDASDIDLAVTLDETAKIDLFRFAAISEQVAQVLDAKVDLVVEPARNPRMQAEIDRDRVRVY